MKYTLFIYEDKSLYGPDKAGPKIQEIVGKHMAFNQQLGAKRIGGSVSRARQPPPRSGRLAARRPSMTVHSRKPGSNLAGFI